MPRLIIPIKLLPGEYVYYKEARCVIKQTFYTRNSLDIPCVIMKIQLTDGSQIEVKTTDLSHHQLTLDSLLDIQERRICEVDFITGDVVYYKDELHIVGRINVKLTKHGELYPEFQVIGPNKHVSYDHQNQFTAVDHYTSINMK